MKILQINCVYGEGSTGRITKNIHEYLTDSKENSVVICGRRGPRNNADIYPMISERRGKLNKLWAMISGVVYGGCLSETKKIKRIILKEKPDIVHLQCINGYFCNIFKLLEFLKKEGIPTVLTLHAEFMYTANCGHAGSCDQWKTGCQKCPVYKTTLHSLFFDRTASSWKRMHAIYKDWDKLYVVACSDWIARRAGQSGQMAHRDIRVIHNGIDNDTTFYPRINARKDLAERYNLPSDKKIVLFVSPGFSALKGFDLFLELVHKCENDPVHFLLVGGEYKGLEKNITSIGKVSDGNLMAELYSAADALVICSRNDNYPTVCLEANSCGTPVIGFDIGGVSETICQDMGTVVPFGDIEAMRSKLLEYVNTDLLDETVQCARTYHSQNRMLREYMGLYKSVFEN